MMDERVSSPCPTSAELAAWIDGNLDAETRLRITSHLVECDRCAEIVSLSGIVLEEIDPQPARTAGAFRSRSWLIAAAVLLPLLAIPLVWRFMNQESNDPIAILASAVREERPIEGRIAAFEYAPLKRATRGGETTDYEILAAASKVGQIIGSNDDASSLHALGLADLIAGRLDSAVTRLEQAAEREPTAEHLSDLSAALLARGRSSNRIADYAAAYENAQRALRLAPDLAPAAFNSALALEAQELLPELTIAAWKAFLAIDSSTPWAEEARAHLRRLESAPSPVTWKERRESLDEAIRAGSSDEVTRLAAAYPQEARSHMEETLLPEWGKRALASGAPQCHEGMRAIAAVQSARGDPWAAETCEELESARGEKRIRLAQGIAALDAANRAYRQGRYAEALSGTVEAKRLLAGTMIVPLAHLIEGGALYIRRELTAAESTLRGSPPAHPSIDARLDWTRGLVSVVSGRTFEAFQAFESASETLTALGESENAAGARSLAADTLDALGERDLSWEERLSAAREVTLAGAPTRRWHATLFLAGEAAHDQGLDHFSALIATALLDRAERETNAERAIDALQVRAIARAALGDIEKASEDIDEAKSWASRIEDERLRDLSLLFVNRAAVEVFRTADPQRALVESEEALERAARLEDRLRLVSLHLDRGRIFRRLGARDRAEAELTEALAISERVSGSIDGEAMRIMHADTAAAIIDEMVDLRATAGRPDEALALVLESGSRELRRKVEAHRGEPAAGSADAGRTLVYAVLDEKTLLWVVADGTAPMISIDVGRASLERRIDRFRSRGSDEDAQNLFDLLIEPALARVKRGETIAILGDGPLHALPFPALKERTSGRRLIELHPLRIALGGIPRTASRAVLPRSALVVGDPAIPDAVREDLPSLRSADAEARAIAAGYQRSTLLTGREATRQKFIEELPRHDVVHFAGHGRSSDREPGASALFLAADEGTGILYAKEIETLSLDGVRLLVLAGCETAEGRIFLMEGMTGVARAALAAGAGEVVATIGRIDDEAAAFLFRRFHAELLGGRSPVDALRATQVAMIGSDDPALSTPFAWGRVQIMAAQ